MSRAEGLNSVNCTNCGAGLSILGGGRVRTHVCGYCGSVLDTQDAYKVITSIGKRNHPASPVQIGMTLDVDGASFTVIGTLGKLETWGRQSARWVEHQLFSETHGYAWLTYENGNFTFTRKVRDYNLSTWLSDTQVEMAEQPPRRTFRGQTYRYYETSTSQIDFMEGEFNWLPDLNEKTTTVVLLGPNAMLGLREGETEREVELTKLLDRDQIVREMGLDVNLKSAPPRHPLTPYVAGAHEGFMRRVFGLFAVAALAIWVTLSMVSGPNVLRNATVPIVGDDTQAVPFDVVNTQQLMLLRIDTDVSNSFATLGLRITGPDGNLVLEGPQTIQFYSGRDSDGSWSEGSRSADIRFRADEPGLHTLAVARVDGTGGSQATLSITSGKPTPIWVFVVMVIFGGAWVYTRAKRALFFKGRFAGSDWHEE